MEVGHSNPIITVAPAQAQSQTQNITKLEYTNIQASLKLLQVLADDAKLCFAKMYSPTNGMLIGCVKVKEANELDNDAKINQINTEVKSQWTYSE